MVETNMYALYKGHMGEWLQAAVGEVDFRWQREFGHVIRVKGILGVRRCLAFEKAPTPTFF